MTKGVFTSHFCNKCELFYGKKTLINDCNKKSHIAEMTRFEIFAYALTGSDDYGEKLHVNRALLQCYNGEQCF